MNQLYPHNNKLFQIKRSIAIHNFIKRDEEVVTEEGLQFVQACRDYLSCEHVLRNQTHFLFCMNVDDIESQTIEDV